MERMTSCVVSSDASVAPYALTTGTSGHCLNQRVSTCRLTASPVTPSIRSEPGAGSPPSSRVTITSR